VNMGKNRKNKVTGKMIVTSCTGSVPTLWGLTVLLGELGLLELLMMMLVRMRTLLVLGSTLLVVQTSLACFAPRVLEVRPL
jgi:hypothetical protein